MPIYEYRCPKCGNVFEEWVKTFDSPEAETCPKCGGSAVRIISNTSFKLEGGGWFASCYGNPSASEGDKPASEDKPSATAAASGKDAASGKTAPAKGASAAAAAPAKPSGSGSAGSEAATA